MSLTLSWKVDGRTAGSLDKVVGHVPIMVKVCASLNVRKGGDCGTEQFFLVTFLYVLVVQRSNDYCACATLFIRSGLPFGILG